MPRESEPRADESPVTDGVVSDDREALAAEERALTEVARGLSVANDLDAGPPRHD